jgi:hypothetical protein
MEYEIVRHVVRKKSKTDSQSRWDDIISTSSLWASIKRTAIGKAWKPHAFEGKVRFLNSDEELTLSE